MSVMIGSARIDEHGKAHGGKAGDQAREVSTQSWYKHSKGWVVIRPKDAAVAEKIATAMEHACSNKQIGYDQWQRLTLWNAVKEKGYDPAKATTACETDCSALVRVCCAYAGIVVSNFRTTDEVKVLRATGKFDVLTDSKYTAQSDYLLRGDILCTKTQGHTVVVLTNGSKAQPREITLGSRTLALGCTGTDVAELQRRLKLLGYNLGTFGPSHDGVDGEFGVKTMSAVFDFQEDYIPEILPNGTADTDTTIQTLVIMSTTEKDGSYKPIAGEPVSDAEPVFRIHGSIPDISSNQVAIDMDAFAAGNDFAILRARVSGKADSKFPVWAAELHKRNFPFAVYDFVKLRSEADAIKQAEAMYAACSPYNPSVYYLDTEKRAVGVTYKKERAYIKAYVDRLRQLGVKRIGQYTGDYRWRTQYYILEPLFDTLWIANWGKNDGVHGGSLKSKSPKIHLQQYTSNGYSKGPGAPGIRHRIDMNRLTGAVPLSWFTGRKYKD